MCLIWNENAASDLFDLGVRPFMAAGDSIDGLTLTMSRTSSGIGYKIGTHEYGAIVELKEEKLPDRTQHTSWLPNDASSTSESLKYIRNWSFLINGTYSVCSKYRLRGKHPSSDYLSSKLSNHYTGVGPSSYSHLDSGGKKVIESTASHGCQPTNSSLSFIVIIQRVPGSTYALILDSVISLWS